MEGKEFEPITTQEEFNKAVNIKLKEIREEYADYEQLKAIVQKYEGQESVEDLTNLIETTNKALESVKAELEVAHKTIEEGNKKIQMYEKQAERARVAIEAGIPYELVDRVQGNTAEEMLEDAYRLAGAIGSGRQGPKTIVLPLREEDSGKRKDDEWKDLLSSVLSRY